MFPERTMLVLSFFEASRKSAPAKAGFYEGDRVPATEAAHDNVFTQFYPFMRARLATARH